MLCSMSDRQIDPAMHPLIRKWDEEPTPRQILEVLDECIHGSLASSFVVSTLQVVYDMACKRVGVTHEDVIKDAPWRERGSPSGSEAPK